MRGTTALGRPPSNCVSSAAVGSVGAATTSGVCATPDDCAKWLRCASSCRSVGKSKMSVSGSSSVPPSRAANRLRSSIAPSESRPASISGTSADTLGSSSAATSPTINVTSTALLLDPAVTTGAAVGIAIVCCASNILWGATGVVTGDGRLCSMLGLGAAGCSAGRATSDSSSRPYLNVDAMNSLCDGVVVSTK